ncbi:Type 1 glutamine amidotransferase-like domain-containing protein [Frigoribacterium sp. PhB116]|uniref:Type 1 glutamine amidotransferase-like domain-containing protein n=1 Tax=Frigoribacterium sp. PhB116 TaxID=2485174 RepID=UPI0010D26F1F|nr:Type 1 glutamine amidotransferase-like domain-containing protein [Frigoribacterium sp. PhB116]TDT66399.1 peptidase S51-like protein [Frigoribacterium sp. PhB116]
MTGLVFLGGGGSEADEAALWAEAFPAGSRVVVWPFAHRAAVDRRAAGAWATTALLANGVADVDVWATTEPGVDRPRLGEPGARGRRGLDGVDVVAVPGGNTFDLLQALREAGLFDLLHAHLLGGGSLYGGSAGAVLAGADIDLARAADPDDVGTTDTRSLDLVHGHDVLPHWTDDQEAAARRHSRVTGRPVLAIPERGGVVVAPDGTARPVGPDDVQVITAERTVRRAVGEEWWLR